MFDTYTFEEFLYWPGWGIIGVILAIIIPIYLDLRTDKKIEAINAERWTRKGLDLAKSGRHKQALICYDEATKIDPLNKKGWNDKGIVLSQLELHDMALSAFDMAIQLDPSDFVVLGNKSYLLNKKQKPDVAMQVWTDAPKTCINEVAFWNKKGEAFAYQHRYDDAIQCFDTALTIERRNTIALTYKGNVFYCLGKYEKAIEAYSEAVASSLVYHESFNLNVPVSYVTLGSEGEAAFLSKAKVLYHLGQYDKVVNLIDSLGGLPKDAYVVKGLALRAIHNFKEANASFSKAREFGYEGEFTEDVLAKIKIWDFGFAYLGKSERRAKWQFWK